MRSIDRSFADPASNEIRSAEADIAALAAELARTCRRAGEGDRPGAGPTRPEPALSPAELARRRDDTYRLASPVLEEFAAQLAPCAHVLSFFDAAGWMLWMGGDPATAERLAEVGFRPGTRWTVDAPPEDPSAAAIERPALELVVSDRRVAAPESWSCSVAPVLAGRSRERVGVVHITARGTLEELVAADAIARAIEERLRSANAVREQVIEFAFRAATAADATFAVDGAGGLIAANPAARRWLALESAELPAAARERLRCALAQHLPATGAELEIEWPGGPGNVKLVASPVRYEQQVIGGIVSASSATSARRAGPARAGPPAAARPVARYGFEQILGESESVRAATTLARNAARNDLPVVLHGDSGTGKELFAQAIHGLSSRAGGPFVAVNCGCIPSALLEAELFGYEPGTFTGGRREGNAGKFERASRGTIFLDEVSELSPQAQAALLRVLQEREVVRLGGSSPRRIDIRVIAATNVSLAERVRAGRFRADLYFRLNVLPIAIPPLRERRTDVALLARAFLREAEAEVGRTGLSISDGAVGALEAYAWPGNVRELRNVVLRTAATAPAPVIEVRDLPEELRSAHLPRSGSGAGPLPGSRPTGADGPDREALLRTLDASAWNIARTAQALHVSRMTLYRWLRKYHIER